VKNSKGNQPGVKHNQPAADAVERVLAAGGRVPKKFIKARPVSAGPTLQALEAQAKVTAARRVAFEILSLVEAGKGHSDDLLRGARMEELSEADKHLATALVMGVLRWQIALDARVRGLLVRPDQRLAEPVALVLRMGAFQLLHMDRIPAHAALSESVELCRAAGHPHASGMVNAILRKMAVVKPMSQKPGPSAASAQAMGHPELRPIFERTEVFAERLGHPAWLVERWVAHYGRAAALAVCEADQVEPGRGRLFADSDTHLSFARVGHPDGPGVPAELPEIDDGSRLVAELAAAAAPRVEGRAARVWDCCAAPGGKTLVLAARLGGAEVLATDVSAKRMAATQGRFRRFAYAAAVQTAVVDAAKLPESAGPFDLILCDVPCSGTGTLGRNPEIRLRLKPEELVRQAERQQGILASALERLAPGGRLVYSTCSLEPEENEAVVDAVAGGFRRVELDRLLDGVPGLTMREGLVRGRALRTLPGVHPCDGFWAVVLERVS
jgi:16S rRNA (cytosine967-C5)-methyltransferase